MTGFEFPKIFFTTGLTEKASTCGQNFRAPAPFWGFEFESRIGTVRKFEISSPLRRRPWVKTWATRVQSGASPLPVGSNGCLVSKIRFGRDGRNSNRDFELWATTRSSARASPATCKFSELCSTFWDFRKNSNLNPPKIGIFYPGNGRAPGLKMACRVQIGSPPLLRPGSLKTWVLTDTPPGDVAHLL